MEYPTRNDARSLIYKTCLLYLKKNSINLDNVPIVEIIIHIVKYYETQRIERTTFVFTNAMIDLFSGLNVYTENKVDVSINVIYKSEYAINEYFIKNIGVTIPSIISKSVYEDLDYLVVIKKTGSKKLDLKWFGDLDKITLYLIANYERYKSSRGMMFLDDDVKQVIIDYSIVLCKNHFTELGFINKEICKEITSKLCNNLLVRFPYLSDLDYILYIIHKDLESSSTVKTASNFITKLISNSI